MKILVLGSNGQLGRCLADQFRLNKFNDVYFFSKDEINITDNKNIISAVKSYKPELIINSSAYTAVDNAEEEFELADLTNNTAVGNLANICYENKIILIHYSTDYVFDGTSKIAYKEDEITNPIGAYGRSKLKGENAIINSGCNYFILRTSWVFSEYKNNFLKTILRISKNLDQINIVGDQIGCPTYAQELAIATIKMIPKIKNKNLNGIYNFSSNVGYSWYDFANMIVDISKITGNDLSVKVNKIATKDFPTTAIRPKNSLLDCKKFNSVFNYKHTLLEDCIMQAIKKTN